jgi:hypothetical protein
MGLEIQSSLIVIHPSRLRVAVPRETVVIVGSPRAGTSIVGYTLRLAGYFLGSRVNAQNHEDQEIAAAFKDNTQLLKVIAKRNAMQERWGFKLPQASLKLEWLASHLRNPVIIVVYRNPLAIARSILSRAGEFEETPEDLGRALTHGLDRTMTATTNTLRTRAPAILVDADIAKTRPAVFLREFLSRLSIEYTEELVTKLEGEIRQPGYKEAAAG